MFMFFKMYLFLLVEHRMKIKIHKLVISRFWVSVNFFCLVLFVLYFLGDRSLKDPCVSCVNLFSLMKNYIHDVL